MTPEQKAREIIDKKLEQSGWIVQDRKLLNLFAGLGVAVREFPTGTGPVDYALFVKGTPVGVIEAKKDDAGEKITAIEGQSNRYVNSTFKWIKGDYRIRFVYEATGKLTRFTDYNDIKLICEAYNNNPEAIGKHMLETLARMKNRERYGRWYYGHDHVHGCEFGGNRGSGSMD